MPNYDSWKTTNPADDLLGPEPQPVNAPDKPMTAREIQQRVDRMILHLDRLLLNRDMSEEDYHAAMLDLAEWEEAAMLKIKGETAQ